MKSLMISSLIGMLTTLCCIWLLRPLAARMGLVDQPGGRKNHLGDTPLIGGIAIVLGFSVGVLVLQTTPLHAHALLSALGVLLLIGIIDDKISLSPKLRLCGQLFTAILVIYLGHLSLNDLGNLFMFGDVQLKMWAIPVTVLIVMAYVNAMNMVDGQDGLAGSIALGQAVLMLALSVQLAHTATTQCLTILSAVLLIFLCFNLRAFGRKRASIFMGDAGSTCIAFLMMWFAIDISQSNWHVVQPMTMLWILAYPTFDFASVAAHRVVCGRSPLEAGRDHLHHIIAASGLSIQASTALLSLCSFALGALGLICNYYKVPELLQFTLWWVMLFLYVLLAYEVRSKMFQKGMLQYDKAVEQ